MSRAPPQAGRAQSPTRRPVRRKTSIPRRATDVPRRETPCRSWWDVHRKAVTASPCCPSKGMVTGGGWVQLHQGPGPFRDAARPCPRGVDLPHWHAGRRCYKAVSGQTRSMHTARRTPRAGATSHGSSAATHRHHTSAFTMRKTTCPAAGPAQMTLRDSHERSPSAAAIAFCIGVGAAAPLPGDIARVMDAAGHVRGILVLAVPAVVTAALPPAQPRAPAPSARAARRDWDGQSTRTPREGQP